jgi:pimeloyl-ACP methyl ester carboxylesterase
MPKPAPPMVYQCCFCTARRTTFTALSRSRRYWRRRGHRAIVPYLRGYGTTRFLSGETFRNGQPSAVALDIIALMDALKIQKATLAGFDWGARTANIIAALWPGRCKGMVSVSGYLIGSQEAGKMPLPRRQNTNVGIYSIFATEHGQEGYDKYRHDFCKLIWQLASPKCNFDDATFDRSAKAFENPTTSLSSSAIIAGGRH